MTKIKIGLLKIGACGGIYSWSTIFRKFCIENGYLLGNEDEKNDIFITIANTTPIKKLLQIKKNGTKIICRIDGLYFNYFKDNADKENVDIIETLKISDFIIFQSNFSRKLISTIFDVNSKPSTIIYNGANVNIFCPNGIKDKKNTNKRIILSLAHFGPPKMSLHSVETFVNISKELINDSRFEFWILGVALGGINIKELPKNITRCELNKWIDPIDVAKELRSSDIVMHIRPKDACSNLILEAMNVNTPVIGLNSGSTPELLGNAGLLCNCNEEVPGPPEIDSKDMANQIVNMNNNYDLYKKLITQRSLFFNSERMCKEYLEIINKLI